MKHNKTYNRNNDKIIRGQTIKKKKHKKNNTNNDNTNNKN